MSLLTPPNYVDPCHRNRSDSIESVWLNPSDFGECYNRDLDSESYPCLIPVYNGEVLPIDPEFVHASLSGISIKHYYGKCFREEEEEEEELFQGDQQAESYGMELFSKYDQRSISPQQEVKEESKPSETESSSGSFEYRNDILVEGQPLCTVPRINHRNSFWNVHRPELSKLTWGQNYVGASTVIEHLHDHLVTHGTLCLNLHTEEERQKFLTKELDEYVRLKVLAAPRGLPPDEPIFSLHEPLRSSKILPRNPLCRTQGKPERKPVREPSVRFINLHEEKDELEGKHIRRSKGEFCITVGKHIRKPPVDWVLEAVEEEETFEATPHGPSEEECGTFFFNWYLYQGGEEEGDVEPSVKVTHDTDESDVEDEPCPPLIMDEFCRAAGKVDLSDLRCNPDDF